ncbi:type II toxin-antitoxin system ParD family antitoxin [Steroidobacter sp.]|uniref:ribbon-helix-helix domain-containing protein n=1 Tax=Steroidobacter sp. TaxID=1978227 RepID=UPI0025F44A54|nr:hypothetical protein [Steroidobacter sp.]
MTDGSRVQGTGVDVHAVPGAYQVDDHQPDDANASDYVRHLIRSDQERTAKIAHIQALVTEGIESGVGRRSMEALKAAARSKLRATNKPSK